MSTDLQWPGYFWYHATRGQFITSARIAFDDFLSNLRTLPVLDRAVDFWDSSERSSHCCTRRIGIVSALTVAIDKDRLKNTKMIADRRRVVSDQL